MTEKKIFNFESAMIDLEKIVKGEGDTGLPKDPQTKKLDEDLKFLSKYKLYKQFIKWFVWTSWIFGNVVVFVIYFDKLISVFLKAKEVIFWLAMSIKLPSFNIRKLLLSLKKNLPFFA